MFAGAHRKAALWLASVVLAMAVVAPAAAQDQGVRSGATGGHETVESRKAMRAFADCMLREHRGPIRAALRAYPGSEEGLTALAKIPTTDCLLSVENLPDGAGMRFSGNVFRGALFAELYRERYSRQAPALVPQPIDFRQGMPEKPTKMTLQSALMLEFADCVVRRDPANTHAALMATEGSAEERGAFSALFPHLSACLPTGSQIEFTKSALTGAFAEVLYREAVPGAAMAGKN